MGRNKRNTKRCPYCGEEILANARKCKHCKEWLDEEEAYKNYDIENATEETKSNGFDWGGLFKLIFWIAVFVIAGMTCPSSERHISSISEALCVAVRKELQQQGNLALQHGNTFVYGFSRGAMSNEELVNNIVASKWSILIHNFGILSVGEIEDVETGENLYVSLGLFGKVLVRPL